MSEVREEDYEVAFQIILNAGEARAKATEAVDACAAYDFEKCDKLIEAAKADYVECHRLQTDMLTKEVSGEKNDVNIILVHAQDHLTMANVAIETAKQFRALYQKLQTLEERK